MAKKLLIVDDSPIDRAHLSKILNKAGYAVVEAVDGKDGIDKAKNDTFDGVLMDIVMPEISGFQATREIHKIKPTLPIIMVSSKNRAPDQVNAKISGAVDYVFKPANEADVLKKIKTHIG